MTSLEFTPFTMMADIGYISILMVVGTFMRRHFAWFRQLLIPASITAGLLGLLLGPEVLHIIPFSDKLGSYSTLLIAMVFASMPYTMEFRTSEVAKARSMWSFSSGMFLGQWGFFILFGLLVLKPFFGTEDWFGMMLPVGFVGGFGTAAAVGSAIDDSGVGASLGFTSATVGTLAAIVGGIIMANWAVRKGKTESLPAELPWSLRSGHYDDSETRPSIGKATTNPSSIEPLALHFGFIIVTVLVAYVAQQTVKSFFPAISIPLFVLSFVAGLLGVAFLHIIKRPEYLDPQTVKSISGGSTDYLIAFGTASIVPSAVASYWVPLLIMFVLGVVYCLVFALVIAPRFFSPNWFERALFGWGWATAAVATGIALLKIVDPDLKSGALSDYDMAYVGFAPIEIGMTILAPLAVIGGFEWGLGAVALLAAIAILAMPFMLGWIKKPDSPVPVE